MFWKRNTFSAFEVSDGNDVGRTLILQLNIENVIGACNPADGDDDVDGCDVDNGDDVDKNDDNNYNESLFVKFTIVW